MNSVEAREIIESWDAVSAANVLNAYEDGELLRPVDRDTDVAIATEGLQDFCYELLDNLMPEICDKAYWCRDKDWRKCEDYGCGNFTFVILARELGIEV